MTQTPDHDPVAPAMALPDHYGHLPRFQALHRATELPPGTLLGLCCRVQAVERVSKGGGYRMVLKDLAGNEIFETLRLPRTGDLVSRACDAVKGGKRVVLFGSFPAYDKKHPRFEGTEERMEVLDLRPLTHHTSMVSASPDELAAARLLAAGLVREGTVGLWMRDQARKLLSVQSQYLSQRFLLGEEAAILQALSTAQVHRSVNSRLSLFITSGTGTGKNVLGAYAELYAALSERVQPGMLSTAGLGASVTLGRRGWTARPGVLPSLSGGLVVLDDLHRIEDINAVQSLLMTTIEEGVIASAKAGTGRYEARAGLLLTSNRLSLCGGKAEARLVTPQERARDIGLPYDLLSRIDVVLELGQGDDAVRSAMEIASAPAYSEFDEDESEDLPTPKLPSPAEQARRQLKLVVAAVKDLIPVVNFDQVDAQIEEMTLKLGVVLREFSARLTGLPVEAHDGDGLIRRMANSLRKLVGARARSQGRAVASEDDLMRAWELIKPKLEVVRWIVGDTDRVRPLPSLDQLVEMALAASEQRWQATLSLLGGQRVKIEQVAEAMGGPERLARRELARREIEPDGVWYLIPTELEWLERGHKLDLRSELVRPPVDLGVEEVPVQVQPEPKLVFEDVLEEAKPPVECQGYVGQLAQMDWGNRATLLEALCRVAFEAGGERAVNRAAGMLVLYLRQGELPIGPTLESQVEVMRDWLWGDGTWEQRGLRALGLCAHSGLAEDLSHLDALERERAAEGLQMPAALESGWRALQDRALAWLRARARQAEEALAKKDQEAAEQRERAKERDPLHQYLRRTGQDEGGRTPQIPNPPG